MREHQVQCLLMGGQACVLYGAAEFSRDTDLAILASEENAERLTKAMQALEAEVIDMPPFLLQHLIVGHAVHFRCRHSEAAGMRVDVMSRMRGVTDFSTLWERCTPELLRDLASAYPALAKEETANRSLIRHAISGDFDLLTSAMEDEERHERLQDQAYWLPLKRDLERLR